jgi:hypothetical protein
MATEWTREMQERFDAIDKRFDAIDRRFDAIDRRFDSMVTRVELAGMEERLHNDIRIATEGIAEKVMKAAEGYGATLESINRNIEGMRKDLTVKLGDHDRALQDHAVRIGALERKSKETQ